MPKPSQITTVIPTTMLAHAQRVIAPINTFASTAGESIHAVSVTIDQNKPLQNKMLEKQTPTLINKHPLSNRDISIITPIQVDKLASYLEGYDPSLAQFLINGFTFGFRIPYQGQRAFRVSKNLSSLKNNDGILQSKLINELRAHRIAGPYTNPPFPNIQVSPLGLVPKKAVGEFRLIHHLSYPEGTSINHNIPKDLCTVQYQSVETAIDIIRQLGRGALLAKTDLENAYKQIPIHPNDFELLGFMIDNMYYYDKTLPFGLSYSCNLFEKFSSALQWILETKFSVIHCVHILDDFLFLSEPHSPKCYSALLAFYQLAKDIGLPIKSEKTVYPTTTLIFLGLELDTLNFEVQLPQDKLTQLKAEIKKFQARRSATLKELQSLIGMLNFACSVVPPGRTFLRRLIDLTIGLKKPYHHRRLNLQAQADLHAWGVFLNQFNGKGFFPSGITHSSSSLHFFTDASNAGFGCTFRTKWFYSEFSSEWLKYHISVREFLPIVIALELWVHLLKNCTVVLHSDNMAVVHVINKNTSKDPHLMQLMRRLMILSLQHNIHFHAKHIQGISNTAADLLSRLQVKEFKARFPHMDSEPTPVPLTLVRI